MTLLEFGFGAYTSALLCVIVSLLALSSLFFKSTRSWLSVACKGYLELFRQLHTNIFLANSLEDSDILLGRLERGTRPERPRRSWYGFLWPFSRKGRGPSRGLNLEKLRYRHQNSDHGVVESVAKSSLNDKANETCWKGSVGKMPATKGKNNHKY